MFCFSLLVNLLIVLVLSVRAMPCRCNVDDAAAVAAALEKEGAVILTGIDSGAWESEARRLPQRLFPGRLQPVAPLVKGVHEEHQQLDVAVDKHSSGHSFTGTALLPHTDGYMYGDPFPDYIFLLVESQDANGGENFVVDAEAVRRRLPLEVLQTLDSVPVDLTERAHNSVADGREVQGPVFQRTPQGRLHWRRQLRTSAYREAIEARASGAPAGMVMPYQSLWAPLAAEADVQAALDAADAAVQVEASVAPRFRVEPGEALLLDNFRLLHGREGYSGGVCERRVWRVWCWTEAGNGFPTGLPVVGSVVDAAQVRHARL